MTWKYRPHRRMLDEAMEEYVEVADRDALMRHLSKTETWGGFDPSLVKIEPYGVGQPPHRDDRIGWANVHIITHHGYGVIGFCDLPLTLGEQRLPDGGETR